MCSVLECAVEEMRLDVIRRRCRVVEDEVNVLSSSVTHTTDSLKDIRGKETLSFCLLIYVYYVFC